MRSLHTPQQETNVAYNPGVTFRGGEFIAQGISQAGNAITAGLQRYAQNREESAALDMSFQTRAQPLLEEMQKFSAKDGQVSPAASLVDKGADWHKFSSSQKKAFLADVVLMGDKQDRARRQQQEDDFRKAAQQFQQDQFTEQKKQHQIANDAAWTRDMRAAGQQVTNNIRQMGQDVRAEGEFGLRKKIYADTQARLATGQQDAETQRGAVGGLLRDFNKFAETPQFNGTGMQRPMSQFEAYRQAAAANPRAFTPQMMDDLGRMAVSEDRLSQSALRSFSPTLGTKSVTLADGRVIEIPFGTTSAGGVDWMPQTLTQSGGKAPVPTVSITTTDADGNKVTRKLTAAEAAALPPAVPADVQKQMADLRKAIARDEGDIGAGDSRLWYGGSRSERLKENRAMLDALERNYGGAKPAAAPAAATATPQSKAQRANALAAENPGWTREQVIEAVNRETSR